MFIIKKLVKLEFGLEIIIYRGNIGISYIYAYSNENEKNCT